MVTGIFNRKAAQPLIEQASLTSRLDRSAQTSQNLAMTEKELFSVAIGRLIIPLSASHLLWILGISRNSATTLTKIDTIGCRL